MISGEKIGHYIASPAEVEKQDIADLAELVKKYPYCSSLKLLHLKGLALNNDLDFERHLKITAIHVPDRGHLYELIHSTSLSISHSASLDVSISEEDVFVSSPSPEVNEDLSSEEDSHSTSLSISHSASLDVSLSGEDELASAALPVVNGDLGSEASPEVNEDLGSEVDSHSTSLNEPDSEVVNGPNLEEEDLDEVEVNILNQAIDVALIDNGVAQLPSIKEEEVEIIETPSKEIAQEEVIKKEALEDQAPPSFVEWLRQKQSNQQPDKKDVEITVSSKDEDTEKSEALMAPKSQGNETKEKTKNKGNTKSKNEIDALLDKFMAEEPRISKPIKDFYNPVKNAKESVVESDDLVSETLAKIHVMQKNYSKAIKAYEKLILLYPEKKTFFASQIEKIREQL